MFARMNSVLEIEQALGKLPTQERLEIARWLLEDLQESSLGQIEAKNGERTTAQPNYAARRRRIFGSKVLPNMVLEARAEERW